MHGGLFSEDGVTLDDIRKIERSRQPPDSGDWVARGSPSLSGLAGPGPARTDEGQRGQASPSSPACWVRAPPSWGGAGQEAGVSAVVIYLTPSRGLPGGPVVRTPRFHCRGPVHPWSGNYNPECCKVQPEKKKNKLKNILLPALGVIQIARGLAGGRQGGLW